MSPLERWSLWITAALTTGSGLVYLWLKYFVESSDPWAVISHPFQPLALKTHILVSPLFVFVLGAIVVKHAIVHLREGSTGRGPSGLSLLFLVLPMLLSGYVIQVVTGETAARVLALIHIGTSIGFIGALVWHGIGQREPADQRDA